MARVLRARTPGRADILPEEEHRVPPVEITIRMTPEAKERLDDMCLRFGATQRAVVEACALCSMAMLGRRELGDAEREFVGVLMWTAGGNGGGLRNVPVNIRLEPEIHARVRRIAARRDVSMSALMAAAFSFTSDRDWGSAEAKGVLLELQGRVRATAQRLDWERRMKLPLTLECASAAG